jgi:hypothetical protein
MTFGSFFTQENNDIWVIFYPGNNDPSGDSEKYKIKVGFEPMFKAKGDVYHVSPDLLTWHTKIMESQ